MKVGGRHIAPKYMIAVTFLVALSIASASVAVAAATLFNGGAVKAVKAAVDGTSTSTNSTTFVPVPSMSVTVPVASGQHALLVVTFSAESLCSASVNNTAGCWVEALMDGGLSGNPSQDMFISDNYNDGGDETSTHSMQFVFDHVLPGTHTIAIYWRITDPAGTFTVNYRTLTVLKSAQP